MVEHFKSDHPIVNSIVNDLGKFEAVLDLANDQSNLIHLKFLDDDFYFVVRFDQPPLKLPRNSSAKSRSFLPPMIAANTTNHMETFLYQTKDCRYMD
jgi:hypothetical protein